METAQPSRRLHHAITAALLATSAAAVVFGQAGLNPSGAGSAPGAAEHARHDAATLSIDASSEGAGDHAEAPHDSGEHAHAGAPASNGGGAPHCHPQPPQPFLIRSNYMVLRGNTPEEHRRHRTGHEASIRYRTEHYGYFTGCGRPEWNAHPPMYYAQSTRFMGLPVRVNRRIVPALQCVEQELHRACGHLHYQPRQLAGIRPNNSFHGGEWSNHIFGIAIDVDPNRNPCCGCGTMFADHPGCTRQANTLFERMEMPECWVHAFERYGFYWMGHDRAIRDLMHFEFLGDPDRITQ
jgi:hypothetical protein